MKKHLEIAGTSKTVLALLKLARGENLTKEEGKLLFLYIKKLEKAVDKTF